MSVGSSNSITATKDTFVIYTLYAKKDCSWGTHYVQVKDGQGNDLYRAYVSVCWNGNALVKKSSVTVPVAKGDTAYPVIDSETGDVTFTMTPLNAHWPS